MLHFVQHDMMMDILFLLWTSNYLVEQGTHKPLVVGSNPSLDIFLCPHIWGIQQNYSNNHHI